MKNSKVIALITDFGLQDQYVSVMKGVILSINPSCKIVDITHDVLPQRVRQAGYLLWASYKYFPEDTIFLSVVDPGVGSQRQILALKTKKYLFLAPDNGLLNLILSEEKSCDLYQLSNEKLKKYLPDNISTTFHGRDIFAPIAAQLTNGLALKEIGKITTPNAFESPFITTKSEKNVCILHIDRFGNIVTNIFAKDYEQISKEVKAVSIGRNLVSKWIKFYAEAPEKTPCLLVGSSNLVEISIKNNNAAHLLGANIDLPVKVYWR